MHSETVTLTNMSLDSPSPRAPACAATDLTRNGAFGKSGCAMTLRTSPWLGMQPGIFFSSVRRADIGEAVRKEDTLSAMAPTRLVL